MRLRTLFVYLFALQFTLACADEVTPVPEPDSGMQDMAADQDLGMPDTGLDADEDTGEDADSGWVDADMGTEDMAPDLEPDMPADMDPLLDPLGTISGECGDIDMAEILSADDFVFVNTIDFEMDPYDPEDFDRLSLGGQKILTDGNAGGSSIFSELIAYEVLFRCEMAELLKTETEVTYTTQGKITDLLVQIDGYKLGVSVTRAVSFPRTSPYTVERAESLLTGKLGDILLSTANVAPADAWEKQILHVIADEQAHVTSLQTALMNIPEATRADTIVVISVSEGADDFIY
jgi:hypothetical protein